MSSTPGNDPTTQHPAGGSTPTPDPAPTGTPVVPAADQPTGTPVVPGPGSFGAPGYGATPPEGGFPPPAAGSDDGSPTAGDSDPEDDESAKLNVSLIVSVVVAGLVVAAAFLGVVWYRHHAEQEDKKTEAAFTTFLDGQGATVETVECDGNTCAAIITASGSSVGQAYTVLVQKDSDGKQHYGISAYTGD